MTSEAKPGLSDATGAAAVRVATGSDIAGGVTEVAEVEMAAGTEVVDATVEVDLTEVRIGSSVSISISIPIHVKKEMKCPICLNVFSAPNERVPAELFVVLRCTHAVCCDCFVSYVMHRVGGEGDAFPVCPLPYCSRVIPNSILKDYMYEDTVRKLHRLQREQQARSIDERPLFCRTCHQQPMLPTIHSYDMSNTDINGNEVVDAATVVCCPNCPCKTCVACARPVHPGAPCAEPLYTGGDDKLLQAMLYRAYAVGRLAPCEHCGTHIERNGGCDEMKCRCGHTFKFVVFRSENQVTDAIHAARHIRQDNDGSRNAIRVPRIRVQIPAAVRRVGCHVIMFLSIVLWIIYVFGLVVFSSWRPPQKGKTAFLVILVAFPIVWLLCFCVVPLVATTRRFRRYWDVENGVT